MTETSQTPEYRVYEFSAGSPQGTTPSTFEVHGLDGEENFLSLANLMAWTRARNATLTITPSVTWAKEMQLREDFPEMEWTPLAYMAHEIDSGPGGRCWEIRRGEQFIGTVESAEQVMAFVRKVYGEVQVHPLEAYYAALAREEAGA